VSGVRYLDLAARIGIGDNKHRRNMSERCLVTGVAGFIGSHLAERLLQEGHEVIGVDCFTDYYAREVKESNLSGLCGQPHFHFAEMDLCSADLRPCLDGVHFVFHHAAQPGVRASWGESFRIYVEDNVLATQRLLDACKGSSVRRFVYASSSSVYGDAADLPVTENSPTRPVSPYGVTKLAGEHLCYLYRANFGVPAIALRYFTVYGPRQRPDMAFRRFIEAIHNGKPIQIYGDGEQSRDVTFVADAVEANMLAMRAISPSASRKNTEFGVAPAGPASSDGPSPGPESASSNWRVWNIGGGERATVNQIIRLLEPMVGRKAVLHYVDAQPGDARHTWADVSAARRELGFAPLTGLGKGLQAQVAWQVDQMRRKEGA
jgi:nucleoside-diphosphate-sugar epimerase